MFVHEGPLLRTAWFSVSPDFAGKTAPFGISVTCLAAYCVTRKQTYEGDCQPYWPSGFFSFQTLLTSPAPPPDCRSIAECLLSGFRPRGPLCHRCVSLPVIDDQVLGKWVRSVTVSLWIRPLLPTMDTISFTFQIGSSNEDHFEFGWFPAEGTYQYTYTAGVCGGRP